MTAAQVRIVLTLAVGIVGGVLLIAGNLALGGAVLATTPTIVLGVGLLDRNRSRSS